ncbi:MAG: flagellin, partial [Phycisphaerales bacterium]
MSRINTNPASLIAQRNLSGNNSQLNTTLERLSTGLRINRGKDDPAGLIASENLRAEKGALASAIGNAERTDQLVNIAEGGLQEVSNLLTDLRSLVTATANNAGLSAEEKNANQLQIDSILQPIDRIADSTNFQGVKLLNGNFDFQTTGVASGVSDFRVNAAKVNKGV